MKLFLDTNVLIDFSLLQRNVKDFEESDTKVISTDQACELL